MYVKAIIINLKTVGWDPVKGHVAKCGGSEKITNNKKITPKILLFKKSLIRAFEDEVVSFLFKVKVI